MASKMRSFILIIMMSVCLQARAGEALPFVGEWVGQNAYGEEFTLVLSNNSVTWYLKRKPEFSNGIELYQIMPYRMKKIEGVTFYQALNKNKDKQFVGYLPSEKELFRFELKSDNQLALHDGAYDRAMMPLIRR